MTTEAVGGPMVERIALRRRVAVIAPGRVDIRPARSALLGPLSYFALGVAAFAAIALGLSTLPLWLLVILLLFAVVALPLGGIGVVYALIGTHVVVDQAKGSLTKQQGAIGLGIGTEELVPFAKIAAVIVEEVGAVTASEGRRVEELAQWQLVVEKTSGKRLVLGNATAARSLGDGAFDRVRAVGAAIATLAGAPLRLPEPAPAPLAAPEPVAAPVATRPARRSHNGRPRARRAR